MSTGFRMIHSQPLNITAVTIAKDLIIITGEFPQIVVLITLKLFANPGYIQVVWAGKRGLVTEMKKMIESLIFASTRSVLRTLTYSMRNLD